VPEAQLEDSGSGLAPVNEGWFVVNASVEVETSDWRQAYATAELFRRERPPYWVRLPWA
jgi:hypothetical protein